MDNLPGSEGYREVMTFNFDPAAASFRKHPSQALCVVAPAKSPSGLPRKRVYRKLLGKSLKLKRPVKKWLGARKSHLKIRSLRVNIKVEVKELCSQKPQNQEPDEVGLEKEKAVGRSGRSKPLTH